MPQNTLSRLRNANKILDIKFENATAEEAFETDESGNKKLKRGYFEPQMGLKESYVKVDEDDVNLQIELENMRNIRIIRNAVVTFAVLFTLEWVTGFIIGFINGFTNAIR